MEKPLIKHSEHEFSYTTDGPAVVRINLFVRSIATISDIKMVSGEAANSQLLLALFYYYYYYCYSKTHKDMSTTTTTHQKSNLTFELAQMYHK